MTLKLVRPDESAQAGPGDGGPEDPMLELRVAALEEKVGRIDAAIQRMEPKLSELVGELRHLPKASDYLTLRADVSEIKGRLSNMPTTWVLISFAVGSCLASAGLAFAISRLLSQ